MGGCYGRATCLVPRPAILAKRGRPCTLCITSTSNYMRRTGGYWPASLPVIFGGDPPSNDHRTWSRRTPLLLHAITKLLITSKLSLKEYCYINFVVHYECKYHSNSCYHSLRDRNLLKPSTSRMFTMPFQMLRTCTFLT